MYHRDMPKIRDYALAHPEGLLDVITFVLLTIQQPFHRTAQQFRDVKANGADSAFLFGSKRKGFVYAQEHAGYLHSVCLDILARKDDEYRKADLIQHFMQIPGLGVAKAAFVVQLIGGGTSCLDTHNLYVLGLPEGAFKITSKVPEKVRETVLKYIRTCERVGSAEHWWNRWCEYVAGKRGSHLSTGDAVSAYHCEALGVA